MRQFHLQEFLTGRAPFSTSVSGHADSWLPWVTRFHFAVTAFSLATLVTLHSRYDAGNLSLQAARRPSMFRAAVPSHGHAPPGETVFPARAGFLVRRQRDAPLAQAEQRYSFCRSLSHSSLRLVNSGPRTGKSQLSSIKNFRSRGRGQMLPYGPASPSTPVVAARSRRRQPGGNVTRTEETRRTASGDLAFYVRRGRRPP